MMGAWQYSLREFWRHRRLANLLLLPLAGIFWLLITLRRLSFKLGIRKVRHFEIPVVVVGCLTAGGGGKTTLVSALASKLSSHGLKVGIVLRGYRRKTTTPMVLEQDILANQTKSEESFGRYGDEAILLSQTGCPVAVGTNRPATIALLIEKYEVDVVLSDDGLQHYAMGRDVEILVLTEGYGLGNGWLLPAGPLREGSARKAKVDFIVRKGKASAGEFSMQLTDGELARLDGTKVKMEQLSGQSLAAVAGIAEPDEFFADLEYHGLKLFSSHVFADHHSYCGEDLHQIKADHLIMTVKDAIKCQGLNEDGRILVFTQKVQLDPGLIDQLSKRIARFKAP